MLLAARDEAGQPMTDRELRDELVTLLVAGHETTASALSWGFEQLVRAPAALARVTDAAVADDTAYLEATVKEILRRRPVLPIAQPRRIKQPVEIGGHTYEPGPALIGCIYLVHHDARLYPEPYAFRPERFLDGTPGKFSWIPFGGGVRRCLGASFAQLEMRIALKAILGAGRGGLRARRPRGHRPPLDHAQPAPRDADLGTPARARAAGFRSAPENPRKFLRAASFRGIANGSWAGAAAGSTPDLPRGLGPAAIMPVCPGGRACSPDSPSSSAPAARATSSRRRRRPRSSHRPRPRRPCRRASRPRKADVAVIRGWTDALRHGRRRRRDRLLLAPRRDLQRRAGLPADQAQAGPLLQPHAAVRREVQGGDRHRRLRRRHARADRAPGPPASAAPGVGNEAYTAFLIRRHKIVQWRRVVKPEPADDPEPGRAARARPEEDPLA